MRYFLAALAALFLFHATAASAQDADSARRGELARRLVTISQGGNMSKMVEKQVATELEELTDLEDDEATWMRENMPRMAVRMAEDILRQMTDVYAETFTAEELQAQVEFYESPMGRQIAGKSFDLGVASGEVILRAQQTFVEGLMAKYCREFDCGTPTPTRGAAKP